MKKYYSIIDEHGEPYHTGKNSSSLEECALTFFDFMTNEMDDEDEDEPFEEFTDDKKVRYVTSAYITLMHNEPFPDEDDEDDED
jgi:hypothetical protein